MRVAYFADDGTEFNTEAECRKYERRLSDLLYELQNGINAYDDDHDEINFSAYDLECLEDAFQDISYIKFNNQKAIDVFAEQAKAYGLCEIEDNLRRPLVVGERYFYDYDEEKWVCLEDKQKELNKIIRMFDRGLYD